MHRPLLLAIGLLLTACAAPATAPARPTAAPAAPAPANAPAAAARPAVTQPAAAAPSAPRPLDRIRIAYGAVTGVYAGTFLAKESGLLEQYGFDAEMQVIPSGPTLIQAMLAGELQFGEMSAPAPMSAVLEGADTVFLTSPLDRPILLMVAGADIQRLDDLRGRTIGANRVGTLTYQLTRLALRSAGLEMNRDVTVQQVGGQPELMAAMLGGQVVGGLLAPPAHLQAIQAGMHVVGDVAEMGVLWPSAGVVSTRRQNAEQPERVANYVRAYTEALYLFRADRERAIEALMKHARIDDRAVAADTYELLRARFIVPPYPNPAAFDLVVQEDLLPTNPRARDLPVTSYYDDRVLRSLDESGFLRDLNARYPAAR